MDILWPVKWAVELVLVLFHSLFTSIGMATDAGITWVLSIVGLTIVVRAALIPVFVKQIKSQRNMMLVQPELQKLQKKYKGKTDRESREKFAAEQMALYKRTGSNPLSSCLPLLLQMPIFFGLYTAFQTTVELRLHSFLWIADLSAPDTLFHLGGFPVNLLPVLMGVTMWLYGPKAPALDGRWAPPPVRPVG